MTLGERATARLTPLRLALLALLLTAPSLWGGWAWDDWFLRDRLSPPVPLAEGVARAFVFMDGSPDTLQRALDSGFAPWWSLPVGKVAFWRPLAALSHALDFRLVPTWPALMHLHSLLWFGAAVAAVAVLYRRFLPAPVAALAGLLYAVDEAHGVAAGWLSNRNALMGALFAALALIAHDRWRREGWLRGRWVAPLCLALALLSAEGAVGGVGYLVAHVLYYEPTRRERLRALLPSGMVVMLWAMIRRAGGYGTWGTAAIEPLTEPSRFLAALPVRAILLLGGQWTPLPPEAAAYLQPDAQRWLCLVITILLLAVGAWLWPLRHRRESHFWALGMALATVVAATTIPAARNLMVVGWGGMALLAMGLRERAAGWRRPMASALGVIHLLLAPLVLPLMALSPAWLDGLPRAAQALPDTEALAGQTVVILHAPGNLVAGYLPWVREADALSVPLATRFLGGGPRPLLLTRVDDHSLIVQPDGGFIQGFDAISRGVPMWQGERVRLRGLTVTVLAVTEDGRPATAQFRFDQSLDSPAFRWLQWQAGRLVPVTLPAAGQTVTLPSPSVEAPP